MMLQHFRIIIILCLISSLARFVLDSYLPSLPAISQSFNISDSYTQLTLTLYLLGFSCSQLIYGPLSDRYGRRTVIIAGFTIFTLGNLFCAIAGSPVILLLARLIAGIGAGAGGVLNRAIASDRFQGAEFSKAWSYTTTSLVITLCVAPVLGGYIQEIGGWRANFILAASYSLLVLAIILKYLPETNVQKTQSTPGKLANVLKNYALILRTPSFISGTLCYTLAFSGLIAYFQVSPLLFIDGFHLTPSQYGWCALLIAGSYLIGGLLVNKYTCQLGMHRFLSLGALLLIAGGIFLLLFHYLHYTTLKTILLSTSIYVIGARIVIPNAIASAMQKLRHLNGSSSALIGCIQMLGSSLISFWIANCPHNSPLPLAIFLTCLGGITLGISLVNT